MERLPGVDVRIVADRSNRPNVPQTATPERRAHERPRDRHRRRSPARCSGSPPATGCRRTGACRRATGPSRTPPHPAAVHRPGDLAPLVRGGRAPGEGRERDHHARLPGARADEPAARDRAAGAVRARHAAARGDRAARLRAGRPGRLARRPRTLGPRRAAQADRAGALRPHHRLRRRRPARGPELRRPALAAGACAGRDPDPAARARGHQTGSPSRPSAATSERAAGESGEYRGWGRAGKPGRHRWP